uniref:Uncharacterized protein n=1 Tax=Anopheles epiroticus TaxID=199890 RepID=A0A182P6E8_9DIPT
MSQQSEKQTKPFVTCGTPTLNDWKLYLRNLQQIPSQQSMTTPDSSSSESSFELEESFKALLERKRQEMQERAGDEHFLTENVAGASRDAPDAANTGNESTFFEQDSISKVSDTSFEEMERICAVLDKVNGFDTDYGTQGETFKPPSAPTTVATLPGSVTLGDITQLEDVDEPSGLWENTILPGAAPVTLSPVKRMHMLRPSTILEETTATTATSAETSKNSTIDTFISAKQVVDELGSNRDSAEAISGSEVYRTAQDTFETTDSYARSSLLDMDSGVTSDITGAENRTNYEQQDVDESEYSKNSTREAVGEPMVQVEQNVIILDSSASDFEDEPSEAQKDQYGTTAENTDPLYTHDDEDSYLEHEASLTLYDEHDETTEKHPDEEFVLDEMPDRFNDTLEETDFMLKQGMKLMALKKQQEEAEEERRKEESQHSAYLDRACGQQQQEKKSQQYLKKGTASAGSNMSYLTPTMTCKMNTSHQTAHSGGFKQMLFSSTGKTVAGGGLKYPSSGGSGAASAGSFKKPVSRLPQMKGPARKFDHIVSPIGAYIKKTPQSMLQARINCQNKNLIDVLYSENRDSAVSTNSSSGSKENHGINLKGYTSSLPGKGVISSHRAHVLDERNVVRIPGGEKMQKLINNSPTMVIRHEGRIKYAERSAGTQERNLAHNMSALTDDSLADLSVLSNDVMSMPAISRMFQMLKGSPVAVVGGTIIVTGSLLYTYRRVYQPYVMRRDRAESEAMANYIFQMEQSKRQQQHGEQS